MPDTTTDYRKYLDPRTLARISSLDLRARLIGEGLMNGMHRSPYQGISVEFAQHRQYVPGDDIRHVDWKVFGRSDKIYLKQYLEETNLHLILIVDAVWLREQRDQRLVEVRSRDGHRGFAGVHGDSAAGLRRPGDLRSAALAL